MWCTACGVAIPGSNDLCRSCAASLRSAPDRILTGSSSTVLVRSVFHHDATARRLVHLMKYQASTRVVELLADRMMALISGDRDVALVPIPRVWTRKWRYGIDQSAMLSTSLSQRGSWPVLDVLRPPIWVNGHAGQGRVSRQRVRFGVRSVPNGTRVRPLTLVLVDDVVTTGSTLLSAADALVAAGWSQVCAVTATSSIEVTSLARATALKGRATWT